MRPELVLAQLYALRAQVDAVIVMVEGSIAPPPPQGCPHPVDKQRDSSTAGGPRKTMCLLCEAEWETTL